MTPLHYFGMSTQLKTVIDRFYSFNGVLTGRKLKTTLIAAAWDNRKWTMKDIKSLMRLCAGILIFRIRDRFWEQDAVRFP